MKLFDLIFGRAIDRRIAAWQSDLIQRHIDEVQNIYRTMRGWRHDYHGHIQTMLALADRPEEIRAYLLSLNHDLTTVDTVLKTGNIMVDAILNSKLSLIKSRDIAVNARATVPAELDIPVVDLCVIIGNLLDNAMEACSAIPDPADRFIRVYIDVLRQQLYISVTNSALGRAKKSGRVYLSAKRETGAGFGLMRIDRVVERNGGYVNRQDEEGVFATEVMLPLTKE